MLNGSFRSTPFKTSHFIVFCPPKFLIRSHQSLSMFSWNVSSFPWLSPRFSSPLIFITWYFSYLIFSEFLESITNLFHSNIQSLFPRFFFLYHSLSPLSGTWTIHIYCFLRTMLISEHFYVQLFRSSDWMISTDLSSCWLARSSVVFKLLFIYIKFFDSIIFVLLVPFD